MRALFSEVLEVLKIAGAAASKAGQKLKFEMSKGSSAYAIVGIRRTRKEKSVVFSFLQFQRLTPFHWRHIHVPRNL
jgi:hypothetical protein